MGAMVKIATPDLVTNSYFPALAAEELGLYREEGLDAHVELLPSLDAVNALRDGAVDFVAGGAHTTLLAFPGWKGAKLVVALSQGTPWLLVLRADLPARRGDVSAVKGLRIGAAPGARPRVAPPPARGRRRSGTRRRHDRAGSGRHRSGRVVRRHGRRGARARRGRRLLGERARERDRRAPRGRQGARGRAARRRPPRGGPVHVRGALDDGSADRARARARGGGGARDRPRSDHPEAGAVARDRGRTAEVSARRRRSSSRRSWSATCPSTIRPSASRRSRS